MACLVALSVADGRLIAPVVARAGSTNRAAAGPPAPPPGLAYAWGTSQAGELGAGPLPNSTTPVAVKLPSGITPTAAAAGYLHGLALDTRGNAWAWGDNTYGELGTGKFTSSNVPLA